MSPLELRLADRHFEFWAIVFAMSCPISSLSVSVERPTPSRRTYMIFIDVVRMKTFENIPISYLLIR